MPVDTYKPKERFQGMKVKKWNLFDFPDNIYILIKKEYKEEFFESMYKKFGSQSNYARFLNINRTCVQGYYYARYWHKGKRCIKYLPLWVIKKSLPFLSKTMKTKIEKNIVSIRGKGGNRINEPILPLQESPAFYRIIAHLIGDGNDSHTPYYANTCKHLREQFKKDLQIFGKIEFYETRSTQNPTVFCVNFTKTVTHILKHILDIRFTHPDKLPYSIFTASEECKKALLQAIFDDEGTVSTSLAIGMKEKRLIQEIKRLCKSINIETSKITFSKDDRYMGNYTLSVKSKSILEFLKKIDFSHPEKHKKLKIRIKIVERNKNQRTRPLEWTRNKILKLLKENPMDTMDLCKHLLLTVGVIYHHLNYL